MESAPVSAVGPTLTGYRDGFWVGLITNDLHQSVRISGHCLLRHQ